LSVIIDTGDVPPGDRVEVIRDLVWDKVIRVDIQHHPVPDQVFATGAISRVGRLTICSVRSNATTIRRTPSMARGDEEPFVFLGLQVSGTSMAIQGDREAILRPGDLVLYDTTVPYTLLNNEGIHQHYFRIPRGDLALPSRVISGICATRLSAANPVADLAGAFFRRLADSQLKFDALTADAVGQPGIELVRATIATQLKDPRLAAAPMDATLEYRIMEYVRAHLGDHDLTPARIARAHGISVRSLYALLARSGISLGDWVREHRLEECRRELALPDARSRTIEHIAHRWGFVNAAHFSRAFKRAYGATPREWRDLTRGNRVGAR
jgi:AraC-like DNA-binding protein